jgi:hypothetical protein
MINYYGFQNLERLRFAETLESTNLQHMEGQRDTSYKSLYVGKFYLVRIHSQPNPFLFLIVALLDDYMIVLDKTIHNNVYKETGNYSKSFEQAIFKIDKVLFESSANITIPKDADLMREYKKFQKGFKDNLKDRAEFIDTTKTIKYYNSYSSRKEINEELFVNRTDLAISIAENQVEQSKYEQGLFQLATIITRLKSTKTSEPQMLYEELYKFNKIKLDGVDIIDYGFLDSELKTGLFVAGLMFEYNLFTAFLNGQNYLSLMLELYAIYNNDPKQLSFKKDFINVFKLLAEKKQFTINEKKYIKEFITDKVDFYYIHLFEE